MLTKNWALVLSILYLTFFLGCALLADVLSLGFTPAQLDLQHIYQPPFQWQQTTSGQAIHWLGTDKLGHDLLANLVYGCRTALLVSVPAMLVALLIGLILGSMAGYYGDNSVRVSVSTLFITLLFFPLGYFYGFYTRQFILADAFAAGEGLIALLVSLAIFTGILLIGYFVSKLLNRWGIGKKSVFLPIDQIVLKLIELLSSIPRIIFILCLTAFAKPSLTNIILITGLTYWTEPARLIRAELLRIRAMHYIESAKALGLADVYILFRHALPNALSSIIVAFTFGLTSLIALESTLSFLGIGIPSDIPSWGKMIMSFRSNFTAWWLVVFPGIMLVCTVLALQTCSSFVIKRLNPRRS
ncbi:ABC transporter permease [Rhodocytophaga rosea]|uniref:ABC transporter permease n=1 Tax=Rhodocytophaga rosea TaxID=2704465 RepID=A0A6C0GIF8_9BACT|nr:ABC transporter permease [Rhodocytophaga rosea]QHT67462.1 ABC transporter permease [Rhodocytophaga rosea]